MKIKIQLGRGAIISGDLVKETVKDVTIKITKIENPLKNDWKKYETVSFNKLLIKERKDEQPTGSNDATPY